MTYAETIQYLYARLPMFSRIGDAAYKKDLHNIIRLCDAIGNPQKYFNTIHIAGTNGKGSTSHMLAAVLQEAGYKTGLYTSPHIKAFGERIRINGEMIEKDFVIKFVERTEAIMKEIEPSFFEVTVAMAFDYFAAQKVDIAVIETGLGGRLDSTNIISPILSVITNIGYDHTAILGNTLEQIASEKAGIIKLNTPVVIGETLPETLPVFVAKARAMQAPLLLAKERYAPLKMHRNSMMQECTLLNRITNTTETIQLDLTGAYQSKNVCTVLTSMDVLNNMDYRITDQAKAMGLKQVKKLTGLNGRWDIVREDPTLILDVGHNEDGIKQVIDQLMQDYPTAALHFVLGFVKDKDINTVLGLFPKNENYYFTNAHIPRALEHSELKKTANTLGLHGDSYDDVNMAIEAAAKKATPKDVIMVCGSFFIVAEVKQC